MKLRNLSLVLASVALSVAAQAVVTGYVNNAGGNSTDFSTAVGATTTYTFDDLATGVINPNAYAGFTLSGNINTVAFGNGPGDGNDASGPLSSGEGAHAASNFLWSGTYDDSLTITFSSTVTGFGLFVVDNFNIFSTTTTLSAYDSSNNLLGSFNGLNYNFQNNNQYFMGVASTAGDIAKVTFSHLGSPTGDRIAIDNLVVATGGGNNVPDSGSTLALLGGVVVAFGAVRRRLAK